MPSALFGSGFLFALRMGCGTSKQKQEAMDEMDVSKHGAESPSYHMTTLRPYRTSRRSPRQAVRNFVRFCASRRTGEDCVARLCSVGGMGTAVS
ncbi:hypothetical protein EMIHUDRAFT_254582 [Emiliania huxleyi CCMP1516]|uniref:Secreted protein n=2 Tax=Emiliania huxleyi TaxID=2903 RepID=A0A0D3JPU1_EMIH1|nr:hypothetical protein EMIHUDRAFT_254582 [Emiliania huxleyi CCMP1516]EOD25526.1 hypothetical protein EMIHUDRAFT_254582 [Emiliania huxleyi CCMP1516]|eukprot:XP_005777955.1 hypothetical protein EMIHUDRAFT_254582 [Emiliania huxleyi CCMP1516]